MKGKEPIIIDLSAILIAEARQEEVATVTPQRAPELLSTFNISWRDLHKIVSTLTAEKTKAEKAANVRRATLLLEVIPAKLKAMDVSSSADMREAVITLDPEHIELQDVVDELTATIEYLKGKMKFFENAYTSVKKIMGEDTYNMGGRGKNPNLSGDSNRPAPRTAPPTSPPRPGFGTPRYGKQ